MENEIDANLSDNLIVSKKRHRWYNLELMSKIGRGKSVLIILAIGFIVNIFQLFHGKFLSNIPSIRVILPLLLISIFLSILFFSKVISYLKSVRFGVALLAVITVSIIIGTFIVQEQPSQFYREKLGSFSSVIFFLSLDSLYKSWWFNSFLLILAISLIVCTVTRKRLNWRELGFYMTHLGIVVILLGALLGDISGVKGFMDFHIGERKGKVNLVEKGMKTFKTKPLGFDVELVNFSLEEYVPEYRLLLWKLSEKTNKFGAILSIKPEDRKKVKLSRNTVFYIKEYYPDFYFAQKVVKGAGDKLNPLLRISLKSQNGREEIFLNNEKRSYFSPDGEFAIHFSWEPEESLEKGISFTIPKWRNIVEIKINGKNYTVEVEKGDTFEKDGYIFKFIDFLPHFLYDTEKKEAFSLSSEPKNPALRVEITGKNGESQRVWIFGKVSGFEKVSLFDDAMEIKYKFEEGSSGAKRHLFVYGSSNTLKIIDEKNSRLEKFEKPYTFQIDSKSITIEEMFKNASIISEYASKSNNPANPAILLRIEGDETKEDLLLASNPEPIYLGDGNLALTFERKMEEIKDYRSKLRFFEKENPVKEVEIEVNKPFKYKGFSFYQSNYDPKDLTYSGIEVVKDPGLEFVWLGFIMLSLGILHSFFIKGRLIKIKTEE